MTLNNNLLRGRGLVQQDKHTRPKENDPISSRRDFINQQLIKQSSLPEGKCPPGTRWHKKLMQCIDSGNIKLLQQQKGSKDVSEHEDAKRSTIKEALINYGKTDKI